MLNLLITRLTAKTVAITIVAVVVVAVVPITLLSVAPGDDTAGHLIPAASHTHPTAAQKVPPRVQFQSDANELITELTDAEAACAASVRTLIVRSRLAAVQTNPILDKALNRLNTAVQPLIGVVQRGEVEVARTTALTPFQLAAYTTDLDTIRLIALPSSGKQGSIAIVCSSVIAQVQQEIAVLKRPSGGGDNGGDGGGDGGGD